MGRITAALYARVSSDGQARGNTVASQLAALRERAAAEGACTRIPDASMLGHVLRVELLPGGIAIVAHEEIPPQGRILRCERMKGRDLVVFRQTCAG